MWFFQFQKPFHADKCNIHRINLCLVFLIFACTGAFAQIIVDTELDALPTTDGSCTLREAVINANDDAATNPDCSAGLGVNDEIIFALGVDTISQVGPMEITDSLIIGSEEQPVTIIGSGESRLFAVPAPVDTEFRFITMTNGFTDSDGDQPDLCVRSSGEGGALCSVGRVTLDNSVISDSQTNGNVAFGGGLFAFQLTASNFSLTGNSTNGAFAPGGGGFLAGEMVQVITNAVVENNSTTGGGLNSRGGGLFIVGPSVIANSRITNNDTFAENGDGGGVYANDIAVLINSMIDSNETLGAFSSGGGIASSSDISIDSSTIAFNQTSGVESSGGGIFSESGVLMQNSTVSNNSASPINSAGGGLVVFEPPVIRNSTISNNSSSRGGAGIHISSTSTDAVELISTILANNSGPAGNLSATGLQVNAEASLFGDDPSEINGSAFNMVFSNDPLLEPLADNGCAEPAGAASNIQCVQTRLLQLASQAREGGSNPLILLSDQRSDGFDRTIGPQTDIGAIEMNFIPTTNSIAVPVFHPAGLLILLLGMICTTLLALRRFI